MERAFSDGIERDDIHVESVTSLDAMSYQRKQEKDYTEEVKALQPEAEQLAKVRGRRGGS